MGATGATGTYAVCVQSTMCEWYTPEPILELVRKLFAPGTVDSDPCLSEAANACVQATHVPGYNMWAHAQDQDK